MSKSDLWSLASNACNTLIPQSSQNFVDTITRWQPGTTPISTHATVAGAMATYLISIFGVQEIMKDRKPLKLKPLFMLHNFLLSAGSAILLVLMIEELVPIIYNDGWFAAICADSSWTSRLETLYIANYYFKYWELADTMFLVVKKKPLQFLHVFHHTATAVLCYTQLNGRTSVSWAVIALNLTVHVIMYYYYFITTLSPGIKLWWKKYLTSLQISQFVIDLFVVYYASYSYFAWTYGRHLLSTKGSCSGSEGAAIFGCALLTSYLFLFIAFYQKTYKQGQAAKAAKVAAAKTVSGEAAQAGAPLPIKK